MRVTHPPLLSGTLIPTPDGKAGAYHTVGIMRGMVNEGKLQPEILHASHSLIGLAPQHGEWTEAETLFHFVRDDVRYIPDVLGVETLTEPAFVLQRCSGDCDDKATLLAALLESVGRPTRFVLAGYTPGLREYEHVYLQTLVNGEWISADPSVPVAFGWEAPGAVIYWRENME